MAEIFKVAKEKGILVCADMTKRKKGETVKDIAAAEGVIIFICRTVRWYRDKK